MSSIASSRSAKPAASPARSGFSLGLWLAAGLLAALLLAILVAAFTLGGDDSSPSASTVTMAKPAVQPAMAVPAPDADSGEIVVDRLPGPLPREISGVAVDTNGNSLDPNLTGPGDDSSYVKDDDDKDSDPSKAPAPPR